MANDPVKLRDDLYLATEKFQLENYLEKTESWKYLGELPGLEDILNVINDLLVTSEKFLELVKNIIKKIMDFIGGIMGSLDGLIGFMASLFNNNLFGFGFPLTNKDSLMSAMRNGCLDLSTTYRYNGLEHYALLSLIIGLGCSGMDSNGFSTLYSLFMNNESLTTKKTELSYLQKEYNTIDSADEKDNILSSINALTSVITGEENAINAMFMTATPQIYSALSNQPTLGVDSIINLTNDIGTTPIAGMLGETSTGLSGLITNTLDSTGGITKSITNDSYESFINTLGSMDSSFNTATAKESSSLASLTTTFNMSSPITSFDTPDFTISDFSLF